MAKHPDRVGTRAAAAGELINAKFYKRAYKHVKAKPGRGIVIGNMGLAPNTDWPLREEGQSLRGATRLVDVLVIFEGPTVLTGDPDPQPNPYDTFDPPEWTESYEAKRFANLIYRAKPPTGGPGADLPSIKETCQLAASAQRRAGRIYVTSDNLFEPAETNPWNTPPEDDLLACPTLKRIPPAP
jgi:hypothetical protein